MSHPQETAEWDGKSAEGIKAIFEKYHRADGFAGSLISMLDFPAAQKGASWQLKAYLEDKGTLSADQTKRLFSHLPSLAHWETELHILQSLPFLTIADHLKAETESFLRNCLKSKNKFVRAWSYNGFFILAQQHPEFSEEVDMMLLKALENEAPSVKARIRNIKR